MTVVLLDRPRHEDLVREVRDAGARIRFESLVMRSRSGTIRRVCSEHRLSKLRAYSGIDFVHHG